MIRFGTIKELGGFFSCFSCPRRANERDLGMFSVETSIRSVAISIA